MSYGLSVFRYALCVSKFVFSHEGAKARRFLFSVIRYGFYALGFVCRNGKNLHRSSFRVVARNEAIVLSDELYAFWISVLVGK